MALGWEWSFSVKSGYHTMWQAEKHIITAASSGWSLQPVFNPWKVVWKVRAKIKSFMWRLLRGILPTRMALAKKITLIERGCVFCKSSEETDIDKHCRALDPLWKAAPFGGLPLENLNC